MMVFLLGISNIIQVLVSLHATDQLNEYLKFGIGIMRPKEIAKLMQDKLEDLNTRQCKLITSMMI